MKPNWRKTNPTHHEFNDAMKAVIELFKDRLTAQEILAITSHLVGVLVAVQDQTKWTPEAIMRMVGSNIEAGNAEAMECLLRETGGNA